MVDEKGNVTNRSNQMPIYPSNNSYPSGNGLERIPVEAIEIFAQSMKPEVTHNESKKEKVTHNPNGNTQSVTHNKESNSSDSRRSQSKQGENNPKFKGWFLIDGVKYPSAHLASKVVGRPPKTIIAWCKAGKNGFSFVPATQPAPTSQSISA